MSGVPWRIGIAGIAAENNTFTSHRSRAGDFVVVRDDELRARYEFVAGGRYGSTVDWVPIMHADGNAGGVIEPETYDELEAELLARLESAGSLDGLLLDIHGAMAVAGRADCEERLVAKIRAVVGERPVFSAAMDPHGNLSRRLAEQLDVVTVHRLSPHEDAAETRSRAADNLVCCLRSAEPPQIAWLPVPMLLNGEMTSTIVEPGRTVFATSDQVRLQEGVLDAGIWIGFAWADEARCHGAVAVSGFDVRAIKGAAVRLAETYWGARQAFRVVAPSCGGLEQTVAAAKLGPYPLFVSDSGDNVTAGASGDRADLLAAFVAGRAELDDGCRVLFAGIADARGVERCLRAGIGADVTVELRSADAPGTSDRVVLDGKVKAITVPVSENLRPTSPKAAQVAVVESGTLTVALSARRVAFLDREDFEHCGVLPGAFDVVVVKNGYLFPYQRECAAHWFMAITPGSTDLDASRLSYAHRSRPLFPLDREVPGPPSEPLLLRRART